MIMTTMKRNLILTVMLSLLFTAVSVAQDKSYQLSSHILDINSGRPAAGVTIVLSKMNADKSWAVVDRRTTDDNGRVKDFLEQKDGKDNTGIYKLTFLTAPYFEAQKQESFYPFIDVVFRIKDNSHYHVPITLSPYGYSTYRGS